ncbi:DinB family protein [Gemmata obscuriglobus]|uniref:Damage-inducible protein DinB n=1 Tax=Gemmata obscuriglobus TaxID=114 RepID=A0A2Z3H6V1_9BACT|nr:DinB family protein [Gemmata obscuriglobus]AWM41733.1 damage-inducible protein DinB [Gemmata obscuriglobus]QEG32319.1 DinB family protein [Gemmata obscuriglobus]VTS11675.1 Uncharacterized protein OS=Blastopirellula marina DSM 3645 GN=DSM3645_13855 PE=4 SV=1: DinB [Gemmata obscuriglobus UQM 2246]
MTDAMSDQYRRWFEYERDANAKVLASLETVPPDRRDGPEYQRAVSVLAHVVAARRVWLERLGVLPPGTATLFPDGAGFERVAAECREVEGHWTAFLAGLDAAALARTFEYRSLDGGRFRNAIGDILAQLFGHSWYHRGQIAMLVRAAGGAPAVTDFIYWCREPVPGA